MLIVLTLFEIMILVFVVILLNNNAFAQNLNKPTLNDKTLYKLVNQTLDSEIPSQIPVGDNPTDIAIDFVSPVSVDNKNTVYVVNSESDTVSVISADNNTKIGEDIPVGIILQLLLSITFHIQYT